MPSPGDLGRSLSTVPSWSESPAGHRGPAPDIKQSTQLCSHSHSWEPVSLHAILGLINRMAHSGDSQTRRSRSQ